MKATSCGRMSWTFLGVISVLTSIPLCWGDTDQKRNVGGGMGYVLPNKICLHKIKGECMPLEESSSTCFGVPLPYSMISPELVNENFTQKQLQNDLKRWEGLRNAPRCWAVIQPLLCSYYFPKCQNGSIELPTHEMCRIARNPCRGVIEQATKSLPDFLNCNDASRFPMGDCKTALREHTTKFNMSAKCMHPMKEVENSFNHYEGFEGCALKCQDPYYNDDDHTAASTLIWYMGVTTLICNGWVVLTFIVEGMSSSQYPHYPSAIILNANCWYTLATVGWLFQYLPLGKEDIVCRKDGTVRRNELTGTENIFCGMVSTWIYFSFMSVLAWMMVFAYVWHLTCNAVGRMREKVDKQRAYFIVWAVAFPTVLSVISLSVGKIDGSSLYGICFVGFYEPTPRIFLVILPIGVTACVILFYLFRGAHRLLSVSLSSSDFISAEGKAEIKSTAFRFIIFSILFGALLIVGLVLQVDSIRSQPIYEKSLRESFLCRLNLTDAAECSVLEKPDVSKILGNVVVFFCGGLIVSSWAWTSSSVSIWRRSLKSFCRSEDTESRPRMPKHKLISKAFAKRNELSQKGHLSLSLCNTHEDPVGLNRLLDPNHLCRNPEDLESQQLNSQATGADGQDISSEWAAAILRTVNRRGALVPPHSSNSASYVSEDSRRPSCDSAMSEQLAARHLQGSFHGLDHKPSRRERFRMHRRQMFNFRRKNSSKGSSTSLESNPGSQILPAITKLIDKREQMGDDQPFVPPNNQRHQQTKVLRELAIQTSFEKLYTPTSKAPKQCNLSNNLCVDKATQSSLVSLHEIGTQTKKTMNSKKKKEKKEKSQVGSVQTVPEDPVLKLLTPN